MSVIIRLQNLPWSANALDIRQYFHGLSIPEGGVHIVGGELGDAFIAFSTDEDARQAFIRNNGKIKEVQISLMLSSRTEMQRVIEAARAQTYTAFMPTQPAAATLPMPAVVPHIMPAVVPDLKSGVKDAKLDKRDKKRSRSRSRDRNRSRDRRDRRHRDRSRSRSRDRRDRRRRDRSHSRDRSRSRERDRRSRDRKRSDDRSERSNSSRDVRRPSNNSNNWPRNETINDIPPPPQAPNIMGPVINVEETRRNITSMNVSAPVIDPNGFIQSNFNNRSRDSWPPAGQKAMTGSNNSAFQNRPVSNFGSSVPMAKNSIGNVNPQPLRNVPGKPAIMDFQAKSIKKFEDIKPAFQKRSLADQAVRCVKVNPVNGGYGDVRRFFNGAFIANNGIKLINDEFGNPTGIVYVQFVKPQTGILNKNGQSLAGVPVSVEPLSVEEFEKAVDRFTPKERYPPERSNKEKFIKQEDDIEDQRIKNRNFKSRNISKFFNVKNEEEQLKDFTCLVVEDLPSYVKEQDILKLFSAHPLISLFLSKQKNGHIAYVKFSTAEGAKSSLEERINHIVGGKQVKVRPCKDEDFEAVSKQHNPDIEIEKPSIETDCVVLQNLPLKSDDRDVADFFSDIGIVPLKIHLMSNNFGFTGTTYCEFSNSEDAASALKKHETPMGNCVVSVKPVLRSEMDIILENSIEHKPMNIPIEQPLKDPVQGAANSLDRGSQPSMHSPAPRNQIDQMLPEPGNMDGPSQYDESRFEPNEYDDFDNPGNFNQRIPQLSHYLPNLPNRPFYHNNYDGPLRGRSHYPGPRGGGNGNGGRQRFAPPPKSMIVSDNDPDAPPGCTVFMKNVPYKAKTGEILEFFRGYGNSPNVFRRYNLNNTPSAEAKVIFETPEEAYRAVQELNYNTIWDRPIYLDQQ